MDEPDIEVRYGAFNALRTLDPTDSYLGRVRVLNDPKPAEDEDQRGRLDGDGDRLVLAATAIAPTTHSPCISSIRKARRWSTSRGPGGPRS